MANLYRSSDGEQRIRDWCSGRLDRWPIPHRTRTVPTWLGPTHLVEAGEGDRVCLYLPGTNFNAATSLGLLSALASRRRVVTVDLPGQPGLSDCFFPPERVDRVVAAEMGTRVDVLEGVGHLAVEEAPERVAALIAP